MPDFNKVVSPGDIEAGEINTVVEISEGSCLKIEWNRQLACFELDRVEPRIFAKPCNYGFIPGTLDEDGDELDTLIVSPEPLPMGLLLKVKVVGILNFIDGGEADHKVVCVPLDNRDDGDNVNSLEDLGSRWTEKVEHHFTHYKDLKKPGTTKVEGWGDVEEAKKIIQECIERFKK
jgi:inorganic pyrophosphatase